MLRVPLRATDPFVELPERTRLPEGMCKPRGGVGAEQQRRAEGLATKEAGRGEGGTCDEASARVAGLELEVKKLRQENAELSMRAGAAEAKAREALERAERVGAVVTAAEGGGGADGGPDMVAGAAQCVVDIEGVREQLAASRGVIEDLRQQLAAAVARADAAEHKV